MKTSIRFERYQGSCQPMSHVRGLYLPRSFLFVARRSRLDPAAEFDPTLALGLLICVWRLDRGSGTEKVDFEIRSPLESPRLMVQESIWG